MAYITPHTARAIPLTETERPAMTTTTRESIATELLAGCPDESRADHEAVASAIRNGGTWDELSAMPELNRWPESYTWVRVEMKNV